MKRKIVALVLVFAVLVPLSAVYGAETIKIGALYTMTGRGGQYGKDSEVAIKMALDEVNTKGLPGGAKLDVIITDDKNPQYAVSVAKRYITDDKCKFLFGIISSAIGLAVTEVSKENKVIFVGSDHAATDLTANKFQKYYFRSSNNTFQSMMAGAYYLKDEVKNWKKIAYIGPDYAYGRDQWMELKWGLDKLGVKYEVVGEYWPKLYEPDYTSYITAIMKASPDILVNGMWGGDTVSFIKQAKPYGLFGKMKYFHVDAGGNYEALAALGADMPEGIIMSARHHNNWPDTPANKAYVEKFYKAAGRYPSYAASGAYAGILMIAEAIRKVGNADDTEALIKALEGMKIQLPEDPPGFTSYIDPKTHQIVQVQAIGTTVKNDKFPPAKYMLGNFKIYPADKLWPSFEYIDYMIKVKGK